MDRSEYHKNWYIKNRERVLQQQRDYYCLNKDKKREYESKNKEKIKKKAYKVARKK